MHNPMVIVVAAVVRRGDEVMLCRRKADALEGGKWEFPGGKVEAGETPEEALARELREELNVEARAARLLDAVVHPCSPYPDAGILLLYYEAEIRSGTPEAVDVGAIRWIGAGRVNELDLAPADARFVSRGRLLNAQNDV